MIRLFYLLEENKDLFVYSNTDVRMHLVNLNNGVRVYNTYKLNDYFEDEKKVYLKFIMFKSVMGIALPDDLANGCNMSRSEKLV